MALQRETLMTDDYFSIFPVLKKRMFLPYDLCLMDISITLITFLDPCQYSNHEQECVTKFKSKITSQLQVECILL